MQKPSTTHEEEKKEQPTPKGGQAQSQPQPGAKHAAPESTYPASDEHEHTFELLGESMQDNEIGRAWSRMFDRGVDLGPAIGPPMTVLQEEFQYFTGGKATRDTSPENVNKTVVFSDARGPLGEESGI